MSFTVFVNYSDFLDQKILTFVTSINFLGSKTEDEYVGLVCVVFLEYILGG